MAIALVLPSSIDLEGIFAAKRIHSTPPKKTSRSAKPQDLAMPMINMPKTAKEWKKALGGIKRDYIDRKFRSCAARCHDLLDGSKVSKQKTAQPVHLVYLHFYAASALEMQVRSLHHTSPYRKSLLDRARDHYRRAAVLAEAEAESASQLVSSRSASAASSHSPVPSVSSSGSTRMSSPDPEEVEPLVASPARKVKHVAFHFTPKIIGSERETYIRPDSPTLGVEERFDSHEDDVPPLDIAEHPKKLETRIEGHVETEEDDDGDSDGEDPFARTRSLHRYATALSSLHQQITTVHLPATQAADPDITALPPRSNEEMRTMELRTRIERLKSQGWQRKRFDAAKYEALREAAIADLME